MPSPWQVLDPSLPLLAATYGKQQVRMVALGLRGGGLVVASPGTRGDEARAALAEVAGPSEVRFLLAPNHFHNAGLADWQRAFPSAQIVAHPTAQPRLEFERRSVGSRELVISAWPEGFVLERATQLSPPDWQRLADGPPMTITLGENSGFFRLAQESPSQEP